MKLATCPDPQQLQRLVEGTLNELAEAAVEEHLSTCESCRSTVDLKIQSADWWQQARSSLRSSSNELEPDESAHGHVDVLSLLGPTDDPEKIGRIAEYEVIGVIGRGGMGVVFKAFDPRLNRFVAIKMLLPHLAASGAARKRFAREGQAAAAVVDDFVLPIYAVAEWQGVPYLVTQYSRGTTLQKRVQTEGPLELKEILRLGMQTARGLAAAHAQGLVHRDVKPSNILLDGSVERAMLTDFGLARAIDDASITRTGIIAGTPQYMSPEQARGGSVDARSDLFSLGCVLYFLCTGHPPFRADNSYAILRLITDEEPRSIREINPDIPAWLCSIVQKLMAKKAEERFASSGDVAEMLEACLAHIQQPTIVPLPESLATRSKFCGAASGARAKGVFMMTGLLAIGLCGMMFWQSSGPPDISGEWSGNEWGTVILKSNSPGRYEGTITNAIHTMGVNPHVAHPAEDSGVEFSHLHNVKFREVQCKHCHHGTSGTIELKWSRLERRFNGEWRTQEMAAGKLSVQPDGAQILGAWTTKKESDANPGTPRLAHLVWKRSSEDSATEDENRLLQEMVEAWPAGSATDEICASTTPPEPTRILLELEIQRGLKRNAIYQIYDDHKDSFRFIVEPVYDKRVPVREYPIIGRASLHLLRYKCMVHFSPIQGVEWPLTKDGKPETEITLYVDSDHLHRENGGKQNGSASEAIPFPRRNSLVDLTGQTTEIEFFCKTNDVLSFSNSLDPSRTIQPVPSRQNFPRLSDSNVGRAYHVAWKNERSSVVEILIHPVDSDLLEFMNGHAVPVEFRRDDAERSLREPVTRVFYLPKVESIAAGNGEYIPEPALLSKQKCETSTVVIDKDISLKHFEDALKVLLNANLIRLPASKESPIRSQEGEHTNPPLKLEKVNPIDADGGF